MKKDHSVPLILVLTDMYINLNSYIWVSVI